jgi:cyclophilin family peptidyl-prolyl cis-trans isomerase
MNGTEKPDMAYPSILSAYAKYKTGDLKRVLIHALGQEDQIIRSTAARLLGEQELAKSNPSAVFEQLSEAFYRSQADSSAEASMGALSGLKDQFLLLRSNEKFEDELLVPFKRASVSPDYLIRRRAESIAKELNIELGRTAERITFKEKGVSRVKRANYKRVLNRSKAGVKLVTSKGEFTIRFYTDEAPLTVENFIALASSGYFNGLAIHRVVPNFVVQDGDSRGDGEGGPGWHIRCEINQIPFERGTVGMALSGKDTGGSQWFVAHSPQPHLDGGYTVFGHVNEVDMKIVDKLARGDVIERVVVLEDGKH